MGCADSIYTDSIIGEQPASIQPSPSIPYNDQLSGSQQLFRKTHGFQKGWCWNISDLTCRCILSVMPSCLDEETTLV